MINKINNLPPQQLPFSKKTAEWRKSHLQWADNKTYFNDTAVRNSVIHKAVNYNLLNGNVSMADMQAVLNPDSISAGFIPDQIQHYPIMNSKLNVLRGEEATRRFDFRVIITNPNAVSEIENNKKEDLFKRLQEIVSNEEQSEDELNTELEKINEYYTYDWQDIREIRSNHLLKHYVKELNIPIKFNNGFMDAMAVGEEIYQCDIVSGEPVVERINPLNIRIFKSGFSNKIEDADIVVLEDFWSPGKIIDTFYDSLSKTDMKYIEDLPNTDNSDMQNYDERNNFIMMDSEGSITDANGSIIDSYALFAGSSTMSSNYIDNSGNIKVLRVYWKSRRKIKKVKSYNPESGEEEFGFYPENYQIDKTMGEEEQIFWINEAWEGTKIGKDIYLNMRPKLVQYNRLSNPSRCHFGIIGSIYNINDSRPFSLVDMMKPYSYLYDAIHDRLNKSIASNWGAILKLDLAMVPKGWEIEKWLYYAKVNHIAVTDSFKEGNIGASTGKIAGALNNNSNGVINAETGNNIQQHINLLEFIKMEMAEVAGISKQREGQISNRETVGGVERATLQSSHITEWIFMIHDDVKKRVLECLLETTKIALKGRSKKFQYILSDNSLRVMDIEGDEFAECDYGLVVDNSPATLNLATKLDGLAQAALQNQSLSFSTIMKIFTNDSLAETQRMIEKDEAKIQKRQSDDAQANRDTQQQIAQLDAEQKEKDRNQKESFNIRDNETKLLIAQMNANANTDTSEDIDFTPEAKAALEEKIREFDSRLALDRKMHEDNITLKKEDLSIKRIQKKTINSKK